MQSMKKLFSCLALLAALSSGTAALAQVAESPAWATRIKAEGLGNSQIDELSQYMTDYVGSRLTASRQKRRADSLMLAKLTELGLSNPRSAFATEFTRGGWDVVKTYCAMTAPYYCAFSVNPRAWSGSTDGLVKGECVIFDVQSKEDLEQYRGKVAGKILLIPSTQTIDIRFEPLASRYTDEQLEALTQDNRANQRPRGGRMNYDYRAMMELRQQMADFYKTEKPLCIVNASGTFNVPSGSGVNYRASTTGRAIPSRCPRSRCRTRTTAGWSACSRRARRSRWSSNSSTGSPTTRKSATFTRRSPAPTRNSRTRSSSWAPTSSPGTAAPAQPTTPPAAS